MMVQRRFDGGRLVNKSMVVEVWLRTRGIMEESHYFKVWRDELGLGS